MLFHAADKHIGRSTASCARASGQIQPSAIPDSPTAPTDRAIPLIPFRIQVSLLCVTILLSGVGRGQSASATSAVPFLATVATAHPALLTVKSVKLDGTVQWSAGSTHESGPASLQAASDGSSSLQFSIGKASRSEIRTGWPSRSCNWTDSAGVTKQLVSPDCFSLAPWFAPTFLLHPHPAISARLDLTDDGAVTRDGATYRKVSYKIKMRGKDDTSASVLTNSTRVSMLYDPTTLLPASMEFDEHALRNANIAIHVRIVYGNYLDISGVPIAHLIQRYVNNSLQTSIQLSNVIVQ